MLNGKRVGVVIPAAGSGKRMGGVAKQFLEIQGRPLIWHVLELFQRSTLVDRISIACPPGARARLKTLAAESGYTKVSAVAAGGERRQDSVWNAIQSLPPDEVDIIAVHDAARPLLTPELLERVLHAACETGAAIAAMPCSDTVKIAGEDHLIHGTIDRNTIWFAQTPQAFSTTLLLKAFLHARATLFYATDEAALLEHAGIPVKVIPGTKENIKITTPDDVQYLEFTLQSRIIKKK